MGDGACQGKYEIKNGLVNGTATDSDIRNMPIFDFEKKVFNAMSEPVSQEIKGANN